MYHEKYFLEVVFGCDVAISVLNSQSWGVDFFFPFPFPTSVQRSPDHPLPKLSFQWYRINANKYQYDIILGFILHLLTSAAQGHSAVIFLSRLLLLFVLHLNWKIIAEVPNAMRFKL